jgi:glycosyltransferase involved in cell wall biosynthesis
VVVPVWDAYVRPLVDVALPSILSQEPTAGVWIVDNASTEMLPTSLTHTSDAVVRVIRSRRRLTVGAARNLGLAAVTGPWVVFWDADEAMPPGLLALLLDQARRFPCAVAVTGDVRHATTGRRYLFPPQWARPLSRHPSLFAVATMVRLIYPVIGALIRTETARRGGGFADSDTGEDWLLGAQLAIRGRVRFADAVVREYEPRRGSLSHAGRSIRQVVVRRRRLRKLLGDDDSLPPWVRRALPLIAAAHVVDVGVFRPLRAALKRLAGQTRHEAAPGRSG